ncbi:unnamed protein product [Pleuronectes platessa]|uniref:Uncharacterized protein n=1 Tax=Pleuronectes platessa TaxID=8262 RepID=A0A9N7U8W0_PLEPL|nr:unnamed protein product [Pleuronectes platessa]
MSFRVHEAAESDRRSGMYSTPCQSLNKWPIVQHSIVPLSHARQTKGRREGVNHTPPGTTKVYKVWPEWDGPADMESGCLNHPSKTILGFSEMLMVTDMSTLLEDGPTVSKVHATYYDTLSY